MLIMEFISAILGCVRRTRAPQLNKPQSPEQFRAVVDRERSRADRCGSRFSLVVFSCPADDCDTRRKTMPRFLSAIHDRIRSTDYAGWIGEYELGMLVVDCSTEQVSQLAMTLSTEFESAGGPLNYRIETYPEVPSMKIHSAQADSDEHSSLSSEVMPA